MVEDVTPFLPGDAVAYLRIADGERRFPFRPVSSGIFLIGQGPSCDLRLGMPGIPSIHSVIQIDAESAEITQIADQPELVINGDPVAGSPLHHGDLIEIGDVRLAFHLCHPAALAVTENAGCAETANHGNITAKLESEIAQISSAGSGRERIQELLKAARASFESGQFAETLRFADYAAQNTQVTNSSDDEIRQRILAKLNSQEHRLDEICHVLEQVVQQQQLIAMSLQCVVDHLDDLKSVSPPGTLRASA